MTAHTHTGPFNITSRDHPVFVFLEEYIAKLDTCDLSRIPPSTFYSPTAVFHNTNGDVHIGSEQIWSWLTRFSSAFEKSHHQAVRLTVQVEAEGAYVVYAEFLTYFWLRGEKDEVQAPMFLVFTIGRSEVGSGIEGLQIGEVRQFWDTGVIGRFITERRRRRGSAAGEQGNITQKY